MQFIYRILTVAAFVFVTPLLVSAQVNEVSNYPDFMKDLQSEEDFDKLTPEQRKIAEDIYTTTPIFIGGDISNPEGTTNCFDYYEFGSLKVDLSPTLNQTVPGANIFFTGNIVNQNPYPVVDGQVYVKIFYTGKNGDAFLPGHGYPLVDQFALTDSYVLAANSSTSTSFGWKVPSNARGGEYMAAFFFQTAKRYNLLGLSFTDDVTGNQSSFTVTSDNSKSVSLIKSQVTLNTRPHIFTAFLPHFTKEEVIEVGVKIKNSTDTEVTVPVTWKLYSWDALREEALKDTKTELVTLKPSETKEIFYDASPNDISVSYLVVESDNQGDKSILDIRWVRDGIEETRINFPSVTKYPLTVGESNTLFSCVHSTNEPIINDGVLTLTLKDAKGVVIHSYKYQGGITGSMMGIKDDFIPNRTLSNFSLTATLERGGEVVEEVTQIYNCSEIDPENCLDEVEEIIDANIVSESGDMNKFILVLVLILSMLSLIGVLILKFVNNQNIKKGVETFSLLFLLVLSSSFIFGMPSEVEAKSEIATVNNIPQLAHQWVNLFLVYTTDTVPLTTATTGFKWLLGLEAGASASVVYKAILINDDTGDEIMDNTSIPVGTKIRVERVPAQDSDIFWNGTGYASDTPYGYWVTDAGPQAKACHAEDQTLSKLIEVGGLIASTTAYTLLDVAPTVEQLISPSSNLSCVGNICTVTSSGPVSVGMNFPRTYGRFYYRYIDHPNQHGGKCHANNTHMREIDSCPQGIEWCRDWGHGFVVKPVPYDLIIPEATISFNLTATGPNTPPTAPTVTPLSLNGDTTNPISFITISTDPDGDTIRYAFDWDDNGTVDEYSPASGYVASGVSQPVSHPWLVDGIYHIRVRAEDNRGAVSPWTHKDIRITSMSASLTGTGCTIRLGAFDCMGTLDWDIQNAPAANVHNVTTNTTYSGNSIGINSNQLLRYGSNMIVARNSESILKTIYLSALCNTAGGEYWTGTTCETLPLVSVETGSKIIRSGETTPVTIKITSNVALPCTVYGVLSTPIAINHPAGNPLEVVYPYTTRALTSDQVVLLTCNAIGTTITKETRISVVGVMKEL